MLRRLERVQGPGEMLSRAGVGQGDADIGNRVIHKSFVSVHFFAQGVQRYTLSYGPGESYAISLSE